MSPVPFGIGRGVDGDAPARAAVLERRRRPGHEPRPPRVISARRRRRRRTGGTRTQDEIGEAQGRGRVDRGGADGASPVRFTGAPPAGRRRRSGSTRRPARPGSAGPSAGPGSRPGCRARSSR
ncbi:MAG: hypothetical protein MZV63_58590 [Marinilabiliales bacterium]|nr:hypothetical protein [Marinilabiliales bacterium]